MSFVFKGLKYNEVGYLHQFLQIRVTSYMSEGSIRDSFHTLRANQTMILLHKMD
jgi:hypothetical protein